MGNYAKELGNILRTEDMKKLRKFCKKCGLEAPKDDDVLEIFMHKMICARTDLPRSIRTESIFWPMERGYRPWVY